MGLQGPIGPRGNSVGSVTVTEDSMTAAGNIYDVMVGIVDENGDPVTTLDAGTFTAPTGPAGVGLEQYDTVADLPADGSMIRIALVDATNELYRWDASLTPPAWIILDDGGGISFTDGSGLAFDNTTDPATLNIDLATDADDANISGLEFNTDSQLAITNPFTDADESKLDALDGDRPIRDWVSGTDYAIGDQVLYGVTSGDLSNVFSVYIRVALTQEQIDAGVVFNNTTPPEVSGTSVGWRLMRSGLVRLQTNGNDTSTSATDTGAGITSNATLRIHQGHGITISRDATTFHISQPTGTHDVDEFMPGWAYSYYDLENTTTRTGTVEATAGNMTFSEGFNIRAGIRLIITSGSGLYSDGDRFAFRTFAPPSTNPDSRTTLFPGATQDYIVYCQRTISPTNTPEATVLQVDPPVSTFQELANLMGLPNDQQTRQYNGVQVAVFGLDEHHVDPAVGTYAWAHTGNLTTVPGNKLESLSQTAPTTWADGDAFGTIDPSWLPDFSTDLGGLSDVTLTTPIADNQSLRYDSATSMWINETVNLTDIGDVTITTPIVDNQFLRYDLATSMWVNETVDISAGLTQETTTIAATGQTVRVMDSSGVDFIAFALPAASATIGNFSNVNLYSSTGTVSRSLVVTTSNFENNPAVTASIANSGGLSGLSIATAGTQVTVSGIPTTTVATITVEVSVSDGSTIVATQNRTIGIVDNRRIAFGTIPFMYDLAGADDLDVAITDLASGARLESNMYTYTLNTGTTQTGLSNPFTIPRTSGDWRIGPNTITSTAVETRAPIRTYSITSHNIQGFRAYFFFASAMTPADSTAFPAASASTVELAAGQTLTAHTQTPVSYTHLTLPTKA